MKSLKQIPIGQGRNLYHIPTDKFKTSTISIFIHRPLKKEEATMNALLPYVLRRGSKDFPSSQIIAKYLEELYGASFDCGVNKKGEDHIIYLNFEVINDRYIPGQEKLFNDILEFAHSILFNPLLDGEGFKKEYVIQEKKKIEDLIKGLVNNKMVYAVERCYQEMCRDEAFSIYELGSIEDLDAIDEKGLYQHYKEVIYSSPIDIFIVGQMDEEKIYEKVTRLFSDKGNQVKTYPNTQIITKVGQVKKIEEALEVNQGKLSLGFRTKISPRDKEYYPLIIYNGILGGGPHSKLFNNVREKMSLAYYVFARLEKFKGLMIISSGIEFVNYQKALDEILTQVEEIKNGNISDYEYEATIKSYINSIRSLADNPIYMTDYYLGQLVAGTDDTFEGLIEKISTVKKEDVISVAQNIELDTIYFLKNKVGRNGGESSEGDK